MANPGGSGAEGSGSDLISQSPKVKFMFFRALAQYEALDCGASTARY